MRRPGRPDGGDRGRIGEGAEAEWERHLMNSRKVEVGEVNGKGRGYACDV
jgi:hypothetical protein